MIDPHYYYTLGPCPLLATAGWKEARDQGEAGVLGVMHVCYNRVKAWGQTLQHVILAPNQITSMSVPSDPEFSLLPDSEGVSDLERAIYKTCLTDAGSILNGTNHDETLGALYYANLAHIQKGGWFDRCIVGDPARHPLLVTIKDHSFFK